MHGIFLIIIFSQTISTDTARRAVILLQLCVSCLQSAYLCCQRTFGIFL